MMEQGSERPRMESGSGGNSFEKEESTTLGII